jgi:lysophospholipase L1-like esterase
MKNIISVLFALLLSGCGTTDDKDLGRVMPLGDSITYGIEDGESLQSMTGGYRRYLWKKLIEGEYTVDFVGSVISGDRLTPEIDPEHEGHPGWTSYEIAEKMQTYLSNSNPDTILLHIGTNDHSTSVVGVTTILNEIENHAEETKSTINVIVALIIDRSYYTDLIISGFNHNLELIIKERIKAGHKNLTLIDMHDDAGLIEEDYANGTHPNSAGYEKMAEVWFNALK